MTSCLPYLLLGWRCIPPAFFSFLFFCFAWTRAHHISGGGGLCCGSSVCELWLHLVSDSHQVRQPPHHHLHHQCPLWRQPCIKVKGHNQGWPLPDWSDACFAHKTQGISFKFDKILSLTFLVCVPPEVQSLKTSCLLPTERQEILTHEKLKQEKVVFFCVLNIVLNLIANRWLACCVYRVRPGCWTVYGRWYNGWRWRANRTYFPKSCWDRGQSLSTCLWDYFTVKHRSGWGYCVFVLRLLGKELKFKIIRQLLLLGACSTGSDKLRLHQT